jgi:hypothetical protein
MTRGSSLSDAAAGRSDPPNPAQAKNQPGTSPAATPERGAPLSITRLKAIGWYRHPLGCHYGWYNTERIQARLGWRSPDEYEAASHADQADHPTTEHAQPEPAAAR